MSTYRTTLLTLPSTRDCVEAITTLGVLFKGVHKRNPSVELFSSTVFTTGEAFEDKPDVHMVTLQADPAEALQAEIDWFIAAAQTLVARDVE